MGWVVVGAGITAAVLLPIHHGCTLTNEDCGNTALALKVAILVATAFVAAILFIAAWSQD